MKNMDTISVKRNLIYRWYSLVCCYSIDLLRMEFFELQPLFHQLGLCFSFPVLNWVEKK